MKTKIVFNMYKLDGNDAANNAIHGMHSASTEKSACKNLSKSSIPRSAMLQYVHQ